MLITALSGLVWVETQETLALADKMPDTTSIIIGHLDYAVGSTDQVWILLCKRNAG